MKKVLLPLFFLLLITQLWAKHVSPQTALLAAERFAATQRISIDRNPVVNIAPEGLFRQLYVFGFSGSKGFVVISADDRALPILAYSLTNDFSQSDMPAHVREWFEDYEDQIDWLVAQNIEPSSEVRRQWDELTNHETILIRSMTTAVGPLLSTTWNQSPYYNNQCPYDGASRSVTGCVATATAQVMKYWNHPTTGHGSHSYTWNSQTLSANFGNTTYQWSNMPNSLTSTSTSNQISAVATLMYHVGVALEMEYSASGSAASTYTEQGTYTSAEIILQTYFKYSNNIRNILYSDMSDAQWKSILKSELDNNRVMIYSGRDSTGGHSFVCDGYNNSNYFHFNWGWGGTYDGFFAIGALNPGSGGTGSTATNTFNLRNAAVIGIQPITGSIPASTTVTATSASSTQGSVSGSGSYNQYDTIELVATANEGYILDHWDDYDLSNPRYAFATSSTFNRTAYFTSLPADTIHYCGDELSNVLNASTHWGIRYPASALAANKALSAVQVNLYEQGQYTLILYQGDGTQMSQVYSQQFTPNVQMDWYTINLTTPYLIDNTKSLWITLSYSSSGSYPMAYSSFYGGNGDGMMLYYSGSWLSFNDYDVYGSWLIKGITQSTAPGQYYTVTATTTGGGSVNIQSTSVLAGSQVTLTATADANRRFVSWNDSVTDYSRTITVNNNINLTAIFEGIGTDTVGYCVHNDVTTIGSSSGGTIMWGVRFVQGSPLQNGTLTGISYYCASSSTSAITAYVFSGSASLSLISSFSFTPVANSGWQTYNLPSPVNCGNDTITIILSCDASCYPASGVSYSANPQGTLVSTDGGNTFTSILNYGQALSWMIRAVVTPPVPVEVVCDNLSTQFWQEDNDLYIQLSNDTYTFYFDVYCAAGEQDIRDNQTYTLSDMIEGYSYGINTSTQEIFYYSSVSLVRSNGSYEANVTDLDGNRFHIIYDNTPVVVPPVSLPYLCGFENAQDTTYWDLGDNNGGNSFVMGTATHNGGSKSLYISNDNSSYEYSSNYTQAYARILIPFTPGDYTVSYDYKCTGEAYSSSPYDYGRLFLYPAANAVGCILNLFNDTPLGNLTVSPSFMANVQSWTHVEYRVTVPDTAYYYFQANWVDDDEDSNIYGLAIDNISIAAVPDTFLVTANVNDSTMGSVSGGGSYVDGDTATLTANPAANHHFVSWSNGATTPSINVVVTKDTTFTATFAFNQTYLFQTTESICQGDSLTWRSRTFTETGVYCDSFTTIHGADSVYKLTLTVNPTYFIQENQTFCAQPISWHNQNITDTGVYYAYYNTTSGCDSIYQLTVTRDTHTVTVNVNDASMGSVTGAGSYNCGASATLTATPAANHHFVSWSNGATSSTISIVVTKDSTLTATFAVNLPDQFTVTVNVNDATMGSVTGGGVYVDGDTATITATPAANHHFVSWSNGAKTPSINVVVTKDTTFTATFALNQTYLFETTESICQGDSYSWRSRTFTATGVYYDSLTTIHGADSVYKLTLTVNPTYFIQENQTICAQPIVWHNQNITDTGVYYAYYNTISGCDSIYQLTVTRDTHTVTLNVNNSQMGFVTGDGSYECGDTATLIATANNGYRFVNWSNGETSSVIYIEVTSDITLTANFESIQTAVDNTETSQVNVICAGNEILVYGASGRALFLYDAAGKLIASRNDATGQESFSINVAGVYFVRIDNTQTFRIVIR